MKTKLFLTTLLVTALLFVKAQYSPPPYKPAAPNPAMNTRVNYQIPGTFRGYGMDPLMGRYTIFYKDGTTKTGEGTMKESGGKQELRLKKMGNREKINPAGTEKILLEVINKAIFTKEKRDSFYFETFNDSYWVYNVGKKLENIYFAPMMENIAVKKENNLFVQLTKEDVLKLVEGNKKAEKFAGRQEYDKAFAEFNQISTSPYRSYKKEE